jgi:hypothetical protein
MRGLTPETPEMLWSPCYVKFPHPLSQILCSYLISHYFCGKLYGKLYAHVMVCPHVMPETHISLLMTFGELFCYVEY